MEKFKVGKLYRVGIGDNIGDIIRIIDISDNSAKYRVVKQIDGEHRLHRFDIRSVFAQHLTPCVLVNKIVITTDGKTTTANLYDGKNVVKTTTAKCSPDDTFDFETGAKIAFDRLINVPEEKPLLNTKICIVKGDYMFITGHIYEIIDGKIKNLDTLHELFPIMGRFNTINDVKDYFSPKGLRKTGETWSGQTIEFVEVIE